MFAALEILFAELADTFPDEYVHVGGDEVHPAWWSQDEGVQAYMRVHGLEDVAALQNRFNHRLCDTLDGFGKRVVAWDEVLADNMPNVVVHRRKALSRSSDGLLTSAGRSRRLATTI